MFLNVKHSNALSHATENRSCDPNFANFEQTSAANLDNPAGIVIDATGNLYVSDVGGVRMIDRNGIIDTVVADRCQSGPLTSDSSGRVYAYCFDGAILRIDGKNSTTTIGTISPEFGFSGDGGPATAAKTRTIQAIAIDRSGNVYLLSVGL